MENIDSAAEEIVRETLSHHYPAFNSKPNALLVADIVTLLNDTAKRHVDGSSSFESDAAYQVRMLLLKNFSQGVNSVQSVVRIFNKLERTNELGWLTE